ncbi:MAG: citrate/2-methylcitrate synthase [Eubacterium sp.]|nr:citrate/2-methylcitrate synthase [Eubacterium sp.]
MHMKTKEEEFAEYAQKMCGLCQKNDYISDDLFKEFNVNRGLRDLNGKGVLTGLTGVSEIVAFKPDKDGVMQPCDGELWYRGHRIDRIIGSIGEHEYGFARTAFLLLFGQYPTKKQEKEFSEYLGEARELPTNFTRDVIMKAPSGDIMNSMTRSILTLASYDQQAKVDTLENNIRQAIKLIAVFPMIAAYSYHAYNHYNRDESMYIHRPDPSLSTAENFLRMLRPDSRYTELEAKALDTCLILHMEHGGGNNSTFTTRVVTSSGSDAYATMAAAMSSLKGPKHGGANIKVMEMMDNIRANVKHTTDRAELREYLSKMLDGEVFDKKGLIYGMGHAVYSLSDPREQILKGFCEELAKEKGEDETMTMYNLIEELAPELIAEKRHIFKGVSPNVDFYSGFVYSMLGIPVELYTPLFAIARIVGWSAHRLEELIGQGKIIRPAYKSVMKELKD